MVYVDDMYKSSIGQYKGMKMSHMFADTHEELIFMAKRLGLQLRWIQKEGTPYEHFDIALSKRKLAVAFGAKNIEYGGEEYFGILARKKEKI